MVPSLKLSFIANGNNSTSIGLTPGSTIHFGSLEFTANRLGRLCLSPQVWDSSAIFIAMVRIGSSSLRTTLEESSVEDGAASGTRGGSGFPGP
jgi:hypothetical protein